MSVLCAGETIHLTQLIDNEVEEGGGFAKAALLPKIGEPSSLAGLDSLSRECYRMNPPAVGKRRDSECFTASDVDSPARNFQNRDTRLS